MRQGETVNWCGPGRLVQVWQRGGRSL